MPHYADLAVIAASAATLVFLVPQIVRLVRSGDPTGVSVTWPALGLVANVGWTAYVVHERLWASVAAPLGAAIGYSVTLLLLARLQRPLRDSALRGSVLASVLVAALTVGGWPAFGVALGLSHAVTITPSVWTAYRTRVPSGVSPGTWWLGVAEAALWGVYGWHHADAGIVTFAIVAIAGSALILARLYWTRPVPAVA